MPGTNFPTSLDTATQLPDVAASDQENASGLYHDELHTNADQAILALETKLGIDGSIDHATVDWKLADARSRLTTAESSIATKADLVSGKVPSSQLPSYVDDVLEYANFAALPGAGETGKIYVTLDTNLEYRWSGSAYIQIVASPGSTDAVPEGTTNLYFTAARVLAVVLSGLSTATNAVITASDTVLSALGKLQRQISDIATTLAGKADTSSLSAIATSGSASDLGTGTLPAARLPSSGVTAGTYGDATHVAVPTVGADGRITGIIEAAITATGGGSGSGAVYFA